MKTKLELRPNFFSYFSSVTDKKILFSPLTFTMMGRERFDTFKFSEKDPI